MNRREEIAKLAEALEGEKERIEKRLQELYDEDTELWKAEHAQIRSFTGK